MNKKMMVGIIIVFFAGIAIGAIGQIITQTQFDAIDFESKSLDFTIKNIFKEDGKINVNVFYTTLEKEIY